MKKMFSQQSDHPPRFPRWLLHRMTYYRDDFLAPGDLEEAFHQLASEKGIGHARRWFWFQAFGCLPEYVLTLFYWRMMMLRDYLKIAFRHMKKQKGFSFINLFGLAAGLACCLLILLWVQNELSYDRFHAHIDSIYRIRSNLTPQPAPLAPALKEGYPEIVEAVRFSTPNVIVQYDDKRFDEDRFTFTDPTVFTLFSFPFILGDPNTALTDPHSVVITESAALKYFGSDDPMGKILRIRNETDLQVTGVIKDIPSNSHLNFDFWGSFEIYNHAFDDNWGNHAYLTYVQLSDGVDADDVLPKISNIVIDNCDIVPKPLELQAMSRIHLYEDGAITYVYIFSAITVFVLLIACINFMNLMTARSATRLREIGIKKVVGAYRNHLIRQFFTESILYATLSCLIAVAIIFIVLPQFNAFLETDLTLNIFKNPFLLGMLFGVTLLTGVLSGVYPALYLSGFRPVNLLGRYGTIEGSSKGSVLRKALVVIQFVISISLIIGSVAIYQQMQFIQNMNLGYEKEQLIYMRIRGDLQENDEAFKADLTRNPQIAAVTVASNLPSFANNNASGFSWEGMDPERKPSWLFVSTDHDYLNTLGLTLVDGRGFSREMSMDDLNFIVNESAARQMEVESPVGTRFTLWGYEGRIIGVVKNFHNRPAHYNIDPFFMFIGPDQFDSYILIRLNGQSNGFRETIKTIEEVWQAHAPGFPFEFNFLDEAVDQNYRDEQRFSAIFKYFTLFAILISCLGLFGLAAYMVERRTKEVGIRKTLGASVAGIVVHFSKEFLMLVTLANVIAWPLAYFTMDKWLQQFAYRTPLTLIVFILSGVAALVIAMLTVSFQAIRAARTNPVDCLRYE